MSMLWFSPPNNNNQTHLKTRQFSLVNIFNLGVAIFFQSDSRCRPYTCYTSSAVRTIRCNETFKRLWLCVNRTRTTTLRYPHWERAQNPTNTVSTRSTHNFPSPRAMCELVRMEWKIVCERPDPRRSTFASHSLDFPDIECMGCHESRQHDRRTLLNTVFPLFFYISKWNVGHYDELSGQQKLVVRKNLSIFQHCRYSIL